MQFHLSSFLLNIGGNVDEYDPVDSKPSYVKMTSQDGQSIVIGETVTTTLKDPQGNVRKITTVESYKTGKGKGKSINT